MKYAEFAKSIGVASLLLSGTGLLASTAVTAQTVMSDEGDYEEVTVTARKKVEALQDVALSVSAMGQREIELNFATDVRDLTYISPNTVLDDTNQGPGGVAAAYIRGVGVSEVEKNFDPAVGVIVDGLFLGSMSGSIARAIDLERVEVARGPQGTLFGRNTIGGVFILQRTKPTMKWGSKMRAGYGSYDTSLLDGYFNMGNGDTFGVKVSGAYRNQADGFLDNLNTGEDFGSIRYKSGGVNALWAPQDGVELEYTFLAERTNQDSPPLLNAAQEGQLFCDAFGICSPSVDTPVSGDRYNSLAACNDEATPGIPDPDVSFDPPGYSAPVDCNNASFDVDTNQFEVRWDLNDEYRLDYIGGKWETEEEFVNDWDAVTPVMFHTDRPAEYEQTTHEVRLSYDAGGPLSYTVGGYFWDSDYEIRLRSFIGFAVPGVVLDIPQTTKQTSESTAFFFEGDYEFSDNWTLTLGGRWTQDEKTTDQSGNVVGTAKADWEEFTPKVALKYELNNDAMVYGLYANGYRAGGFNGRVDSVETATLPYAPETVDNFEIGYRSEWYGGSLIFNATAFYMDYQDKQEEIQQPSTTSGTGQVTRVVNASNASITGAEFEVLWRAADGLTVRGNLGLLDASYDDFLVNTGTADMPVMSDFSNLELRRAPDVTATVGADYGWNVGPGEMLARGSLRYLGSHEVDFANKPELHNDSQMLVDASLNYYYKEWYFSAFGHNLADEDGYQIGFDVAGLWSYAAPRAPRTFGFEMGFTF